MLNFCDYIRSVPDFPKPGILFRDITPLLRNADAYREMIDVFCRHYRDKQIDYIAAVESRGYLIGAPLAARLGAGLVIIRKPGKLPARTICEKYSLEYGADALEIHADAIEAGKKILIADDLLATGGTALAACNLIKCLQGDIIGLAFLIELEKLNGRKAFPAETDIFSLIKY